MAGQLYVLNKLPHERYVTGLFLTVYLYVGMIIRMSVCKQLNKKKRLEVENSAKHKVVLVIYYL